VRKAVFPFAGLGTRFLPATKAQPKEMLPIVDKPIIQYGIEEALDSGWDAGQSLRVEVQSKLARAGEPMPNWRLLSKRSAPHVGRPTVCYPLVCGGHQTEMGGGISV